jgi:hypothetical protein
LERAGLLEPGGYVPGFWDQATAGALAGAMTYANRGGTTVQDVIAQLVAAPKELQARPEFVPPPEIRPDPAAITQRVKAEFRSRLGREPTDEELGEYAGYLSSQFGAAYDAQVAMARSEFDQGVGSLEADEAMMRRQEMLDAGATPAELRAAGLWDVDAPTSEPGSFSDVDPAARFGERFDARFAPEIDFIEGQEDTIRNAINVFASLRNMAGLVG